MASSYLSSSSVCFDCSSSEHRDNTAKPMVNIWLDNIREQINIERKVDINHYYYVKSLKVSDVGVVPDDCVYYSECDNYDNTLSQRSEEHIKLQLHRDCLLIRDLERKLNNFNIIQYVSKGENEVIDIPEYVESSDNIVDANECGKSRLQPLDEYLNIHNDKRKGVSLEDEHFVEIFNSTSCVLSAKESNKMSCESLKTVSNENASLNEINPVQCIGQVVIKVNELGNSNRRLSLNLLLDKNFLDLCKHVSRVSTKTNEEITDVDKAQLSSATSIELTIPTQQSGDEIDIDISLDHEYSSESRANSIYESALDLEDKVHTTADVETPPEIKMRNKTWIKEQRPQSMYENIRADSFENMKRINRASLFDYSESINPFFFPSSTYIKRRHEQYLLDCDGPPCHIENTSIQQTVGLPGCEEHVEHLDSPQHVDHYENQYDSNDSSPTSMSSEVASYESFTADDSTCPSEYNTLDSRMMDVTSHTFETLLFVPRQSYRQMEQDSVSDVTCSRFSSMEAIVRDIVEGHVGQNNHDEDTDNVEREMDDKDDSISSDVEQWMTDIFKEAFGDSEEDWKPNLEVKEEPSLQEHSMQKSKEQKSNLELLKKEIWEVQQINS